MKNLENIKENENDMIDGPVKLLRIYISVRNLVEFVLRSGDIDNRHGGPADKEAMQIGRASCRERVCQLV